METTRDQHIKNQGNVCKKTIGNYIVAVLNAVNSGRIDKRRYQSFIRIRAGD